MSPKEFSQLLTELRACPEVQRMARGKSLAEVWQQCERGDWLLWLCGRMVGREGWPTRQEVVLAACACAETALKFEPEGEGRPRKAIETARKWARGEAALDEVRDAAAAAYAAGAAAAAGAADAAADAYADADAAAYAAAAAAGAAYAAADADRWAFALTREASLKSLADLVRSMLHVPIETQKAAQL